MLWAGSCESLLEEFTEDRIDVRQAFDVLHREVAVGGAELFVLAPQVLGFARGDLDVGEVLHEGQDALGEELPAVGRVVFPVVAVGCLGAVNVPGTVGVALMEDVLHQLEGARNHGASRFSGVQEVFPDYFLTFGEKWGQDISIPSQIIPVGNKYLEGYVGTIQSEKEDKQTILVVSQGTVTERMVEIAKAIATAFPEKKIIYKLHPGEIPFKERYQELEAFTNIEIIGFKNILPLIAKAKYIVGYNSTTLFEALAFPGKVIFCPPNSYTCGEKGFNLFDNSEQLIQMIRNQQGKISDGVAEEYWSKDWESNVKRLPFLTTGEPL